MKTKKIVTGAMAAAMLSLSICSLMPASAAGETVQISVSSTEAEAGGQFTVEVSLADIPTKGIQVLNFSLGYDEAVISIDKVEAGKLTDNGTGTSDPSTALLDNFNSIVDNTMGSTALMWTTSLEDSTYWLKGEGVLCTITGTVAAGAADGEYSIDIIPTERETSTGSGVMNEEVDCGYLDNGKKVPYDVSLTSGIVKVGGETTTGNALGTLRGDANCDGSVDIADATLILQVLGNGDKYELTASGMVNADVAEPAGLTAMDSLMIQQYDAKVIDKL
ncbi:MAG: cohesin domain-containing protein [Alistipes sp.]|nr:cohesin domain-containing protein [Alistipes sp.]